MLFGGQHDLVWKTLTAAQALDLARRLAAELASLGVREGDRVVLWLPTSWQTPLYYFALWSLGAIVVPYDREMNPEAGARILTSIEPRLVIVGFPEHPAWAQDVDVTQWWEPGTRGGRLPESTWTRPSEELAAIYFTSGTTGVPKGCMITHANLCAQVEAFFQRVPLGADCRMASVIPLSHLFELTAGLLYPVAAGVAIHYVPSRRGPDVVRVLTEQHVTHMLVVPQLLSLMGQALQARMDAALPATLRRLLFALAPQVPFEWRRWLFWPLHRRIGGHLRLVLCGGAALPAETQRLWENVGVRVIQGYGASECSPGIACGAADGSTPVGSVGRPLPGVSVKLAGDSELLVRGPSVMRGYWRDATRTAEVLDADGWYHTGDIARIDATGDRLDHRSRSGPDRVAVRHEDLAGGHRGCFAGAPGSARRGSADDRDVSRWSTAPRLLATAKRTVQ